MRTETISIYSFSELSEDAKQNAIEKFRNKYSDSSVYFDEITETAKKVADLFNLKFGREYTDIRYSHIDETILELSGIRLYKYIFNNYGYALFKPAYIKTIDRPVYWKQFICKVRKGKDGEYTHIHSRNKKTDSCTLTGVCYDEYILSPVYNFLAKPSKNTTFEGLIKDIEHEIGKCYRDVEEWTNSDEFIIETIEANNYEFTEDGEMY
jgi:hypothetical protein